MNIIVLDYRTATVTIHQNLKKTTHEEYEDFLDREGYNSQEIEWMVVENLNIQYR